MCPRRRPLLGICVVLALTVGARAWGGGPADALLKLVPADAGLTISVEDLRGRARTLLDSPLVTELRRLPAFKAMLQSAGFQGFEQSRAKLEALIGEDIATLRDKLFGEAVVLSLRLPEQGGPESARGLLLVRAPDGALLDRLIAGLNARREDPEPTQAVARRRGGTTYHVRTFRPGTKLDEYYAVLGGGDFAWSNSEDLIRGAIDRSEGQRGGLSEVPAFQRVRQGLPERALASLFVDPRFVARVLAAAPRSGKPEDERVFALVGRYLSAVRYAGAGLEWQGGPLLHTEEVLDPQAFGPDWKRWAAQDETGPPALLRVPSTAVAAATVSVDLSLVLKVLLSLVTERDQPKVDNLLLALQGVLLGRDVAEEILPQVGPGVLIYVERPDADGPFTRLPGAVVLRLRPGQEGVRAGEAIENGLRTLLAAHALDERHDGGRLQVESSKVPGGEVTSLSKASPFAYSRHEGQVIVGTSAGAVARALAAQSDPKAGDRFEALRSAHFPGVGSFACLDLRAALSYAESARPALARRVAAKHHQPEAEAARDLDHALSLISLFDAAFITSTIDRDLTRIHRTLGLVGRAGP
jgi:hypothetical protein